MGCWYDVLSVPPVLPALPADPALTEYLDALDELFSEVSGTEYEVLSALSDEDEVW